MYLTKWHRHLLFFLFALFLSSCDTFGCNSDVIAELSIRNGNVERDFALSMNDWKNAPISSTFKINDGVRTLAQSTAELTLAEGSIVVMQPNTQLRFASSVPNENKFGMVVESGSAKVEAKSDDLHIETGIGMARLKKGSAMTLRLDNNELTVHVDIGSARFMGSDGSEQDVSEGDEIVLSIGSAELVSKNDDSDSVIPKNENIQVSDLLDEETDDDDADGEEEDDIGNDDRGEQGVPSDQNTAQIADFAIAAGERIYIHAMHAPVAVEFRFGDLCADAGYVKVAKKKIRGSGTGSVILNLPLKAHSYEVRCVENGDLSRVKKRGRITVLMDKGKLNLSNKAPTTNVDADGRDYNVMYQSKLPRVVMKWPDAPKASAYKLYLTGSSGTKTISLKSPQYRFSSGALKEGAYKFKFTVSSTGKRSRTSSLKIRFDNATPKAVLKSPGDKSYASGASVEVSGIALPGWNASVYGKDIPMDEQHRFSGSAKHSGNYLSLPVKLTHALRGTHYFLRRAK
ncbi:MAG: FecR domain-containing protein [Deltaproteobacteria bacterium]|nr:FecR domain-containing protein [Deltaproteobacteria bacterium]